MRDTDELNDERGSPTERKKETDRKRKQTKAAERDEGGACVLRYLLVALENTSLRTRYNSILAQVPAAIFTGSLISKNKNGRDNYDDYK